MKKQSFKDRSIKLMIRLLGKMIVIYDEPWHNDNKRKRENS